MTFVVFLSVQAYYEVILCSSPVSFKLGNWQDMSTSGILSEVAFNFDAQSVSMLIPISLISCFVQYYSQSYLRNDAHIVRFFNYLNMFSLFMIILVTADNLLLLFQGWEGVGLVSYLQISYWFTRMAASKASLKAFFMNRVGDWGYQLGLILILTSLGTLSISLLNTMGPYIESNQLFIFLLLMLLGASAKSAQFGLHGWLANAMEGPTPVSSQLHSATMVTAGVYLLMRLSPQLEYSDTMLILVTWQGSQSALQGASSGLVSSDIKKVIAYSTSSQQGYMFVAIGLSQSNQALYHLLNHAFFKALLFMSAGAIIHALNDEQDLRKMGGQSILLPNTYSLVLVGSLSIMAFPFFTGFYSKDYLLLQALTPNNITQTVAYVLTQVAAVFTSIYSVRQILQALVNTPNYRPNTLKFISEPDNLMFIPMLSLGLGAVVFGYQTHDIYQNQGQTAGAIQYTLPHHFMEGLQGQNSDQLTGYTILGFLPMFTQLSLLFLIPVNNTKEENKGFNIAPSYSDSISYLKSEGTNVNLNISYSPSQRSLSVLKDTDIIYYNSMVVGLRLANILNRNQDRGIFEIVGPLGIYRLIHSYSNYILMLFSPRSVYHYLTYALQFIIIGLQSIKIFPMFFN